MALFFTREETADKIIIRYTAAWLYLLVIGLGAMLILSTLRLPFDANLIKQAIFAFYVVMFVIYYIVTFKTRREIFQGIRERRIKISGSRFNPRRPLVVTISKTGPG
ncbi:MAG: hypothetical protein ACU84Q_10225 [Gammaproteobacteria bacterium]